MSGPAEAVALVSVVVALVLEAERESGRAKRNAPKTSVPYARIWSMPRRQVLVQLDDERLALLDERAARAGHSRSALIRAAIDEYLEAELDAQIDAAIVAGYEAQPQEADPWAQVAAREAIAAEPW
jgi:hypothetical protein